MGEPNTTMLRIAHDSSPEKNWLNEQGKFKRSDSINGVWTVIWVSNGGASFLSSGLSSDDPVSKMYTLVKGMLHDACTNIANDRH